MDDSALAGRLPSHLVAGTVTRCEWRSVAIYVYPLLEERALHEPVIPSTYLMTTENNAPLSYLHLVAKST